MGIGDWGLGIGDWAQSLNNPPKPQIYCNPIPNTLNIIYYLLNFIFKYCTNTFGIKNYINMKVCVTKCVFNK